MFLNPDDADVTTLRQLIDAGAAAQLAEVLERRPELARARIGDPDGESRTCLHVATDWPGQRPDTAAVIGVLIDAGADVDAPFAGAHRETALHWAASNDDVPALDALLDRGASIEAPGGVLTGGPPLDDAVIFAQWRAARRLVERGASVRLFHAAALGLVEQAGVLLASGPSPDEVTAALWHACRAGEAATAKLLVAAGGDPDWVGFDGMSPRAVARASGHTDLAAALDEGERDDAEG